MLNLLFTPRKNKRTWAESVTSVDSSIAMENHSKSLQAPFSWSTKFFPRSSVRRATVFADKLIALNNENFSGQISSTDIIIQSFINWPSVKGFPALVIMWLTLKLALKADSFYCIRLVKICLCADNEFFLRRNFVFSKFICQIFKFTYVFCIIMSSDIKFF